MKIVVDTNVIVSGLLSPFGPASEILRMISSGALQLCYDARIISEYRNVLARPKFAFEPYYIDCLLDQIKICGYAIAAKPLFKRLPDSDDEPFLEVSLAGKVKCLITGNIKHYPIDKRAGMLVLSPAEFLNFYRKI